MPIIRLCGSNGVIIPDGWEGFVREVWAIPLPGTVNPTGGKVGPAAFALLIDGV
jgi:hypothetical protein